MSQLLLHPQVRIALKGICQSPPQGLLLVGESGVGLGMIARQLSAQLSGNAHTVRIITPDEKGTIAIETVRELYVATRSMSSSRTVIIIDDADAMSQPAQNALLKLLEEPTAATIFILTSHQPTALLPTVRSRVQRIAVPPISTSDSAVYLKQLGISDPTLMRQLLFLAVGRPALLTRLVNDTALRQRYLEYAKNAKEFIAGSNYQRIVIAVKIGNDREAALHTLRVAMEMLRLQLKQNADDTVVRLLARSLEAYERIFANGNVKAQLLSLSV